MKATTMNEIGHPKWVTVRHRVNGKMVPKLAPDGQPERKLVRSVTTRITREPLGGNFGSDRKFRLVVRLKPGDIIEIGPHTTQRRYAAEIKDVYRWLVLRHTNLARLEKARTRLAAVIVRKESAKLDRAEARLRRQSKAAVLNGQ